MSYLLDTNACIALIKGTPPAVRAQFQQVVSAAHLIATSSVVVFELWYCVARSAQSERNAASMSAFLAGPIEVIDFDADDARAAGSIRAALEMSGRPIGAYDLLIAGQALRHGATLVTANTSEFARVAGLTCENWAVASTA